LTSTYNVNTYGDAALGLGSLIKGGITALGKADDISFFGATNSGEAFLNANSANARVLLREDLASQAGVPRNISDVWGTSLDDIGRSLEMDGATFTYGKRATSNAESLKVSGHPEISEVVAHPGGGQHVGPYYKFDMKDGSQIKIIDPSNYRPKTILDKTTFYNQQGEQIKLINGKWVNQ
jgi:filamentous hemagglutinin